MESIIGKLNAGDAEEVQQTLEYLEALSLTEVFEQTGIVHYFTELFKEDSCEEWEWTGTISKIQWDKLDNNSDMDAGFYSQSFLIWLLGKLASEGVEWALQTESVHVCLVEPEDDDFDCDDEAVLFVMMPNIENLIHLKEFCIFEEYGCEITDEAFHENLWTLPNIQKVGVTCHTTPYFDLDLEQLCIQYKHSSTLQEVSVQTEEGYFNPKIMEDHPTLKVEGVSEPMSPYGDKIVFLKNVSS